ncbi:MAG: LysR family transcriptional regulator [Pigmentiphaga sp.]|uniref:LysR family transcriptional regulator n=1 Tax=Pigmentiphaga sp. TaxID=1977564 RepID=UPI0029B51BD0|nr:LysR family transcriptional regulator [Pigmentiphaga sp.]MDX3906178.1 LysR family transcriptional regulator [Pigmentiphaga sp.]
MNLSTRSLRAFLTLASARSFTRAAQQLHISQPGLSLMMRELESQLACQLFERTTRSVELTGAGRQLLARARRIVEELDSLAPALSQASVEQRRTLHVAATPMFSASVMPEVYMRLRESHPTISIHLIDAPKPEVENLVRNGMVDCGLGIFAKRLAELVREPLFKFDFIYVESRKAPVLFRGRRTPGSVAWRDLPDVPFVELGHGSELQQLIAKCKHRAGKRGEPGFAFNNLESLLGMAAAGVGPTILPSFVVPASSDSGVSIALLNQPVLSLDFHLISRRGRPQPAALDIFRNALGEVIRERGEQMF